MSRDIHQVVADIDALPTAEGGDLDRLQSLLDEYFASPAACDHIDVWFRIYERFPNNDGYGVFWTILHGLEAQDGCDEAVVASVRRQPTHFPVLMVNRMLNANIHTVAGVDLHGLLRHVASNMSCPADVREDAKRFLEHQRGRAKPGAAQPE